MNLTELLENAARRWPDRPAIITGDSVLTYAGLIQRIDALSSHLEPLLKTPGARVGLCLGNCPDYIALTYALWRNRAVVIPVPAECPAEEASAIAQAMRIEVMVCDKPRGADIEMLPGLFLTRLAPPDPSRNHGLNIAFTRFTSGTTSTKKGVVLTHETVCERIVAANKALRITSADVVMWCLPMSHHFLVTIVLYLAKGAAIVLARQTLARPFLEAIRRWQGTVLYAAPFHYSLLAQDASELGIPSVRLAVSTTCGLPEDVARRFRERFGLPLVQALGIIELGLVCANLDDPVGRWNSVGRPLPDYRVRIANPDAEGNGDVEASGPGFFDGYDAPWTPREQWMTDGWFATGDVGRLDAEGFLFLAGRKSAVINLAGRKVFPEEIEAVLNRHPSVRASRVYGTAHPHLGEIVEAEVALQSSVTAGELRDFCRGLMSPEKVPLRIHLVQDISRTTVTGKILRQAAVPVG
jgi:long-chain acyl-CoA synthetase